MLARAGVASRRSVEEMIRQGRIRVNGLPATLGDRLGPRDTVSVDGRLVDLHVTADPKPRVIAYNKPIGEIVSRSSADDRPSVFDALPKLKGARWVSVGRLDINSTGLLLFTTDGNLAHRLMHPSSEIDREYVVRVQGKPDEAALKQLLDGVELEDGPARFNKVVAMRGEGSNSWFRTTLREGRKREVRRMWEAVGHRVSRLIRVRVGPVTLERDLRSGQHKPLTPGQIAALYRQAGLTSPEDKSPAPARKERKRR